MRAVKKTAAGLDGVDKVEVDFESKRMTLTMKEGKSLDEKTLKKAYADTNYSVKDFKAKDDAEEEADKEDAEEKDTGNLKATITGMM